MCPLGSAVQIACERSRTSLAGSSSCELVAEGFHLVNGEVMECVQPATWSILAISSILLVMGAYVAYNLAMTRDQSMHLFVLMLALHYWQCSLRHEPAQSLRALACREEKPPAAGAGGRGSEERMG